LKNVLFLSTIILCLGVSGPATVAGAGTGVRHNRADLHKAALHARNREAIRHLNLSPEQKKRLQVFKAEHHKRVATLNAKIYVKRVELKNEMEKPSPDPEQLKRITEEIGQLKTSRDLERLKAKRELEKILTPEQSEELKRMEREAPPAEPEPDEEAGE
jgi:Spy/CpxP family protein refolding chaperone